MQIAMLGPLEVRADSGAAVPVAGARLRTLLIRLALEPGRVVTTPTLIDALWGDDPPAGAANALQALVSRLRRVLPGHVESHPTGYLLRVPAEAVDANLFERQVRIARAALAGDPARAADALGAALALWRGPALADVAGADFARAPVAHLTELRLAAAEDRVDAELGRGDGAALVPELEALLTAHPLRERLAGQLMRALAAAGRPAEALATYERIREALAESLGTDPSPELAALHLKLLRAPEPPAPAAPARSTNLPAPLTSFVGRDLDVNRVAGLLDGARLTTLIGPGGAGKTRLAIESARTALPAHPDGAWLVELAPVTDPAELTQAVLTALGQREQPVFSRGGAIPPAEPIARLVGALGRGRQLLILDNCEHLIDAVAKLADRLLADCPRLHVLATSREPLSITGETLYPVEPLALPPADAEPAAAVGYAAVRLLADRARAVRPDFAVDAGTVGAAVRICRALDGMPLAIELAAARLRALTPHQVAARLDDRFRLLTGGSRAALPRHQTLRAVVDWSWDLLDEPERALLRRLSVFAGSAGLAAIERVCSGPDLPAEDVFERLAALVDKSLLVPAGEDRYRQLETIREYGLGRLAEAGEADRVRRAWAEHFLRLAQIADNHLRGRDQLPWLARLATDQDNLYAVMRWSIAVGDAPLAVRLAAALGWYFSLCGNRAEGADLAQQALSLPGEPHPADVAIAAALAATNSVGGRADFERARQWMARAAELAPQVVDEHPMLRLVGPINAMFDPALQRTAIADLQGLFDDAEPWVRGIARVMYAHLLLNYGHPPEEAEDGFRRAAEEFERLGDRWGIAFSLTGLADLAARRGAFREYVVAYRRAIEETAPLGASEDIPQMQARLAYGLWLLGERDRAWQLLDEARAAADRSGIDECVASVAYAEGELLRASGHLTAARERLEHTEALVGPATVAPQWVALINSSIGFLDAAQGLPEAAGARHRTALDLALSSHDAPIIANVLVGFADLALRTGQPTRAAAVLGAAVGVRGGEDHSLIDPGRLTAEARAALGEAAFTAAFTHGRDTATTADSTILTALTTLP